MRKLQITNVLILLFSIQLSADIGHFDIYSIIWKGSNYFLTLESPGSLENNDLCYYDYNMNYKMEVKDYIDKCLKRDIEIRMFTGIEEILLDSLRDHNGNLGSFESPIYAMRGLFLIHPDSIIDQYELIGAKKGNIYGTVLPQSITEKDNDWILKSTMKNIFYVDNGECGYSFYCSNIEPESEKAKILQRELQGLMPKGEGELDMKLAEEREKIFLTRVEGLLKDQVLMLGGCSC